MKGSILSLKLFKKYFAAGSDIFFSPEKGGFEVLSFEMLDFKCLIS